MSGRALLDQLPDDASLPVWFVRRLLLESRAIDDGPDLTVPEVAALMGRSASCVRGWCRTGELDAYRFKGREWRVPRPALAALQERERTRPREAAPALGTGPVDLSAWRRVRS